MDNGQYITEYYKTIFKNNFAAPETKVFPQILEYLTDYLDYSIFENTGLEEERQRLANLEFLKMRLEEIEYYIKDGNDFSNFSPDCDFDMAAEAFYKVCPNTAQQ